MTTSANEVSDTGAAATDARDRFAEILAKRLPEVVRMALADSSVAVVTWTSRSPKGGPSALDVGGSLLVFDGIARAGDVERPWSVVLKVLAPAAGKDDPAHIGYWKREALLYGSKLRDDLSAGLRAPRCYKCDELEGDITWLWLEHVAEDGERVWPIARWALAARYLGRFNGAYLAAPADRNPALPPAPWLGGRRLRTGLERHEPLVARIATAPDNPAVRHWWPRPIVDAVLRLWDERDAFCEVLERLPQAFGHGDAIRRNLFFRNSASGAEELVAIDWEFAGYYALGEEVGQTLSVASAFYDIEPAELPALDETLFDGYLAGLRDVGWRGDERSVRFAYAAHAALRNLFNAVGTMAPDEARRNTGPGRPVEAMWNAMALQKFGHSWEKLAERRAEIRPFLLDRADEARRLMETL
ncbi:MAG: hypothetical protein EPO26_10595 [Chloroflexota bacterium]|nr:MAG: hypothetical protein EPO26_10595 [Chloroflexota bacterium]